MMGWFKKDDDTKSACTVDMYEQHFQSVELEVAPTDRGVVVPSVDIRCTTFEEYKSARCSALLSLHYETPNSLIGSGLSLAEMLEKGYREEVLRPSLLRN